MDTLFSLSIYTVIAAFAGFAFPYFSSLAKDLVKRLISISAGILIGLSLFHLIPDSFEHLGDQSIIGLLIGFFFPIFLERFSKREFQNSHHAELPLFNMITFLAFSLHSFSDGLLLNTQIYSSHAGTATFIGIVVHKFPVAFSLVTILKTHISKKKTVALMLVVFALMTPLGAFSGYYVLQELPLVFTSQLTSITAGVFLYIGIVHLFYDHHLYRKMALNLFFLLGILLSNGLFLIHH